MEKGIFFDNFFRRRGLRAEGRAVAALFEEGAEPEGGEDEEGQGSGEAEEGELEAEEGGLEEGHRDAADGGGAQVGEDEGELCALVQEGIGEGEGDVEAADGGAAEEDHPEIGQGAGGITEVALDVFAGDPDVEEGDQEEGAREELEHNEEEIIEMMGDGEAGGETGAPGVGEEGEVGGEGGPGNIGAGALQFHQSSP